MRKSLFFTLFASLVYAVGLLQAQTYDLYQMSNEEFAAGGDKTEGWSFERYDKTTGVYAPFTMYDDSSKINLGDTYGPYRFAGELKGEMKSDLVNGQRDMAYVTPLYSLYSDRSEFVYLGNKEAKFETQATKVISPVFVFTVPQDGYYRIQMSVQNQDAPTSRFNPYPMIVNRYRYATQNDPNQVNQLSDMGMNVSYCQDGIYVANGQLHPETGVIVDRNWYTPFQPESYYICFKAKQGDKITVEATYGEGVDNTSDFSSGHSLWNRTRWHALSAAKVTQAEAEGDQRYVDPYATADKTRLEELYYEAVDLQMEANPGKLKGQYPAEAIAEFNAIIQQYEDAESAGAINVMTVKVWEENLADAIAKFKSQMNEVTWAGHYKLFPFDATDDSEATQHNGWFSEQLDDSKLNNARWKFFSYINSTGKYTKIANYATAGKYTTAESWHDGTGDWFYIARDGTMHPLANKQPAIIFTAPQDGYYKVYSSIKRDNNGSTFEMYARYRYISGDVDVNEMVAPKESFVISKGYGLNRDLTPADTSFYIQLKAGDRLTFEQDCYTPNSNSSAGSSWAKLAIIDMQEEYGTTQEILDVISADDTRILINPFAKGDFAGLIAKVAEYNAFLLAAQAGEGLGQYPAIAKLDFQDVIDEAQEMIDADTAPQHEIAIMLAKLNTVYTEFLNKKNVAICTPAAEDAAKLESGLYYIKVDGYYLTVPFQGVNNNYMLLETKIPNPNNETLNRQVWNVQYNVSYTDPARYTLVSDTSEVWASTEDGRIHFDELGRVKIGGTTEAQQSGNEKWRNHSLYFDGTSYCIFNLQNNKCIVIKAEVQGDGSVKAVFSTSSNKEFIYEFVKKDDDVLGVENEYANGSQVAVYARGNSIVIDNAQPGYMVVIYDISGRLVKNIRLSGYSDIIDVNPGLYIVKVSGGNGQKTGKVIVR